ncbi:MAG: hypothetical protein R3304_13590 [Longimicrobiales bacterium]|nr:hypothetical protein [Longimicrobiales bacterium]
MTGRHPWPDALELAEKLNADSGDSVRAVLLYGSRLQKTNPDRHSALDFVVLVDDYISFYRGLADSGELHRPAPLMRWLAGILPPNVIAYAPEEGASGLAKCAVVDQRHLARALGPDPPDHFLLARLIQEVGYVWSASDADEAWVRGQIREAQRHVVDWMLPYLEDPVDAERLGRRMLAVCYRGELRPESRSRSDRVFEAQAPHLVDALEPALEHAVETGMMEVDDGEYVVSGEVPDATRRKWARHFRKSKIRATLRWFKHMLTFANWLPYIQRKVERHTGRDIELTPLEKKLPLVFLWPRAIHVLLTRPRKEVDR